jgi:hypothetical protein
MPKPCTYLGPRLTLSPNGPKWASTWHTLPKSTIECVQNDFHACDTFSAKCAPIIVLRLTLSPRHLGVPSSVPKMIFMPVVHSAQIVLPSYTEINTISKLIENEHLLNPHHLGVPSGASKIISEPMVCSVQTGHLTCTKINIVSKWIETSVH